MLPSETMIWQPEFTDKTLSRKPGAVQYRRDIQLALKQEKDRTNETAMRPLRKATIDKFPEYIDPRLRNYRSRYGAISND